MIAGVSAIGAARRHAHFGQYSQTQMLCSRNSPSVGAG
jgi:hypothetical protein